MPEPEQPGEPQPGGESEREAPATSEFAHLDAEVPPVPVERRYPSTVGGAVYLLVLAGSLVGLGVAATGSWRQGVGWVGTALLVAAAARLVLTDASAGMLRVRNRYLDAVLLTAVGITMLVLSVSIPDQPL